MSLFLSFGYDLDLICIFQTFLSLPQRLFSYGPHDRSQPYDSPDLCLFLFTYVFLSFTWSLDQEKSTLYYDLFRLWEFLHVHDYNSTLSSLSSSTTPTYSPSRSSCDSPICTRVCDSYPQYKGMGSASYSGGSPWLAQIRHWYGWMGPSIRGMSVPSCAMELGTLTGLGRVCLPMEFNTVILTQSWEADMSELGPLQLSGNLLWSSLLNHPPKPILADSSSICLINPPPLEQELMALNSPRCWHQLPLCPLPHLNLPHHLHQIPTSTDPTHPDPSQSSCSRQSSAHGGDPWLIGVRSHCWTNTPPTCWCIESGSCWIGGGQGCSWPGWRWLHPALLPSTWGHRLHPQGSWSVQAGKSGWPWHHLHDASLLWPIQFD